MFSVLRFVTSWYLFGVCTLVFYISNFVYTFARYLVQKHININGLYHLKVWNGVHIALIYNSSFSVTLKLFSCHFCCIFAHITCCLATAHAIYIVLPGIFDWIYTLFLTGPWSSISRFVNCTSIFLTATLCLCFAISENCFWIYYDKVVLRYLLTGWY